tara:strand:- start:342 stop:632 length:291 start_codon:yes stop_codon:yes gene_type:complete
MKTIDFIVDKYALISKGMASERLRIDPANNGRDILSSYTITISKDELEDIMSTVSKYRAGFWEGLLSHLKHLKQDQDLFKAQLEFVRTVENYVTEV